MNILLAVLLTVVQQSAPTALEGIVVKAGTAEPIVGVMVELSKVAAAGSAAPAGGANAARAVHGSERSTQTIDLSFITAP